MTDGFLTGRKILIVEDEWLIAEDIRAAIIQEGGEVMGPLSSNAEARDFLTHTRDRPDAATLNIRLTDGPSFPTADALVEIGVRVLFVSATEAGSLPPRFARVAILTKPVPSRRVVQALAALL